MQFYYSQENKFFRQLALNTSNAVLTTASKNIATNPFFFTQNPKIIVEVISVPKDRFFLKKKRRMQFRLKC